MSLLDLNNLTSGNLKKRLLEQIDIEDLIDRCSKCGHPQLIHKNFHRDVTCTEKATVSENLNKQWEDFTKRIDPILKIVKEDQHKDIQGEILPKGLKELLDSNTKSILLQTKQMNETWVTINTSPKVLETNETNPIS